MYFMRPLAVRDKYHDFFLPGLSFRPIDGKANMYLSKYLI